MTDAETILWFAMTALFGGGLCYIVRGLLGESVRLKRPGTGGRGENVAGAARRHRVTWSLVGLGAVLLVMSGGSLWGVTLARGWYDFSHAGGSGSSRVAAASAAGLLMPCFVILAIGIVGDRAKGRKRCPGCWYDMSAGGARCPECGHEVEGERDLLRSRRRRWPFAMGALLVAASLYAWTNADRIQRAGALGAVPTTALVLGWSWLPDWVIVDDASDGSLLVRIQIEDREPWFLWRLTGFAMGSSDRLETLQRAAVLRNAMTGARYSNDADYNEEEHALPLLARYRLGSFLLSRSPSSARELELMASLARGTGYVETALITWDQANELMGRLAAGEALGPVECLLMNRVMFDNVDLAQAVGSAVDGGDDGSRTDGGLDLDLVIAAIEGQPFAAGSFLYDRYADLVGVSLIGAPSEALERVYALTTHPDPGVREFALRCVLIAERNDDFSLPERVRPIFEAAWRDTDPRLRAFGARVLLGSFPPRAAYLEEIATAIRSTGVGRAGLIPDPYSDEAAQPVIQTAVIDAIGDADPAVAIRAAEFAIGRIAAGEGDVGSLVYRVKVMIEEGTLSSAALGDIRDRLYCAVYRYLESGDPEDSGEADDATR